MEKYTNTVLWEESVLIRDVSLFQGLKSTVKPLILVIANFCGRQYKYECACAVSYGGPHFSIIVLVPAVSPYTLVAHCHWQLKCTDLLATGLTAFCSQPYKDVSAR